MTLATRRFLYIIFIAAFISITPLVIAYAAGYQLAPSLSKPFRFQKTGMLILNSTPTGAKIHINGEVRQDLSKKFIDILGLPGSGDSFILTPAKIKNLLPGEYDVKLEKDGHWEWQKKLTIRGGESTYAEDVFLFRNTLPLLLANGEIKKAGFSDDKKKLAAIAGRELIITDSADGSIRRISLESDADSFSLSPDNKRLIAGGYIYDLVNGAKPVNLSALAGKDAINYQWSRDDKNSITYISSSNGKNFNTLKKLNLADSSIAHIIAVDKIENYFSKDGNFYIINTTDSTERMNVFKEDGTLIADFELPKPNGYDFINQDNGYINILNEKQRTLYLIDTRSKFQIVEKIENVSYADWINQSRLLYCNDSEIWFFDMDSGYKTLLTRISSSLRKVYLHPSNNYIIFVTDNAIKTIELDDREKRNITELFQLEKISFPELSAEGDMLYFTGKIGNQEGLYKLAIQ